MTLAEFGFWHADRHRASWVKVLGGRSLTVLSLHPGGSTGGALKSTPPEPVVCNEYHWSDILGKGVEPLDLPANTALLISTDRH